MAFNPPIASSSPFWDDPNASLPTPNYDETVAYTAPSSAISPLDGGSSLYPMFGNPFTGQLPINNLNNEQFASTDGSLRPVDGFSGWESNGSSMPTSATTAFDGSWPRHGSFADTDYSSQNQANTSTSHFGQLPERTMQPVYPAVPSHPRPKPGKRPSTSSAPGKRKKEEKGADDKKKNQHNDKEKGKANRKKSSAASQQPHPRPPMTPSGDSRTSSASKIPKTSSQASSSRGKGRKKPVPSIDLEEDGDDSFTGMGQDGIFDEASDLDAVYDEAELDGNGGSQQRPKNQRERNRMAATKCRAKTKAAISQLEEDDQLVSENNDSLHAQVAALRSQVVHLRTELLQHGDCDCPPIQSYIQNAAVLIGETGGRNPIWGPDGRGSDWTEYHPEAPGP